MSPSLPLVGRVSTRGRRAKKERCCSCRGFERVNSFFPRLLCFRDAWLIEQADKLGLRPRYHLFYVPPPGYRVVWGHGVGAAPVASR